MLKFFTVCVVVMWIWDKKGGKMRFNLLKTNEITFLGIEIGFIWLKIVLYERNN